MGITCGNCHGKHDSVATVKLCYDTRSCIWQIPASPGYVATNGIVLSMDEYNALLDYWQAEAEAERLCELRAEQWWEERGAYEPDEREEYGIYGRW